MALKIRGNFLNTGQVLKENTLTYRSGGLLTLAFAYGFLDESFVLGLLLLCSRTWNQVFQNNGEKFLYNYLHTARKNALTAKE